MVWDLKSQPSLVFESESKNSVRSSIKARGIVVKAYLVWNVKNETDECRVACIRAWKLKLILDQQST